MRRAALAAATMALPVAACSTTQSDYRPPAGNNEVLRGPIASAPQSYAVMADVVLGPGGAVPRHKHPGEEFLYVIEGSTTLYRDGEPPRELIAGHALRIAPGTVHWATAGPNGLRAVVLRVGIEGQPERTPVPE